MPRYLLSVFGRTEPGEFGPYPSREAMEEAMADTGAFNEMLEREGHLVLADGLQPPLTATTVDGQGEEPVVTSGHRRGQAVPGLVSERDGRERRLTPH